MNAMSEAIGSAPESVPSPDEIRAALDHILFSEVFRRSPQLGAFLRFVTEAVLQGKGDRIKAYTIGVEVLRRDANFDPQIDPIVRVEATRLRRAIERYYAGPGQDDSVIIDLPRGSYVPTFRHRQFAEPAAPLIGDAESGAKSWAKSWPRRLLQAPMLAMLAVMAVVVAAALVSGLYLGRHTETTSAIAIAGDGGARRSAALPPGNGMPVVLIEPIRVMGTHFPSHPVTAERLRAKIGDAFARFDTINVASGPALAGAPATAAAPAPPNPRGDYVLSGSLEYAGDAANAWFTLASVAEGKVVWSRTFEHIAPPGGTGLTEDSVVIVLTNSLLQSYGVIRSRDRANQLASNAGDPRYRCVLEAADSMQKSDRQLHNAARACLENLTAHDPSFALGFTFLAMLYNREFQLAYDIRSHDPPLERALRAARQGILLNPESARGYLALMIVQSNRRDAAAALEAGRKMVALNKYDMLALGEYGGRLIMAGEIEQGMAMLREAGSGGAVRPSWHYVYLFIGSTMTGDGAEAVRYASSIPNDNTPLGLVAQLLAAHDAGKPDEAKKAADRLRAVDPGWVKNPREELSRIIPARAVVDRLAKGLAAAGLPGGS
jgi:tetratricopeptide (TPR) repeat protein